MRRCVIAFCTALLASSPLQASPIQIKIFGHDVFLTDTSPSQPSYADPKLSVDGRELHSNSYLNIIEITAFGDTGVVIGSSGAGGNACDIAPFVISFPAGKPARFDGPLEVCGFDYIFDGQTITFTTGGTGTSDQLVYSWKPSTGFTSLGVKQESPDETKGWEDLRQRDVNHPSEVLLLGEIASQTNALLNRDDNEFQWLIMNGVGSGKFNGDIYVGTACKPHACMDAEAILFADIQRKKVFLAWKPEGKPIVVRPKINEWPDDVKFELKEWADDWTLTGRKPKP